MTAFIVVWACDKESKFMSSKLKIDCYWYLRVLSPQVKLFLLEVAILQLSSCGGVLLN